MSVPISINEITHITERYLGRVSDIRVGSCIVGKSNSGWAWFCVECGDGKVAMKNVRVADKQAQEHRCQ